MTTTPVEIRRGVPADAAALAEFGRRTYEETYGPDNDPQNLVQYLAATYGLEQQAQELISPDVITLLADMEGRLVGFAQVRHSIPPECVLGEQAVELWRFYVDRPWHGRGVAQRLMAGALRAAAELGGRRVWLSVWERNPRAIAFYARCGFEDAGTADFWVGSERQMDCIMIMDLARTSDGKQPGIP